jgi:hypothetical protein
MVKMEFLITTLLPLLIFSTPVPQSVYCGSDNYSPQAISEASNAACNYLNSGTIAGRSTYPHQYKDYEGFTFGYVSGPYFEFPILPSGDIYSGGRLLSATKRKQTS